MLLNAAAALVVAERAADLREGVALAARKHRFAARRGTRPSALAALTRAAAPPERRR